MLTLTGEDLVTLTGRSQAAAQIRWLKVHGWIYDIGADGKPRVACAYFERRMVYGEEPSRSSAKEEEKKEWQVNVIALRDLSPTP